MERPSAWKSYSPEQLEELHYFNEGYKAFISDNKTERECSATAIRLAKEAGYIRLSDAIAAGQKLKTGDKVYADIRGKSRHTLLRRRKEVSVGYYPLGYSWCNCSERRFNDPGGNR